VRSRVIQRLSTIYTRGAVIVLNTVLLLVLVELVAAAVMPAELPPTASPLERDMWIAGQQYRYHPHILWRHAPLAGARVHIDAAGLRVTPGNDCGPSARRVWMLGGSAVWGYYVADDQTIPAHLQRILGGCVVNFGQSGFTSTQDVIQLEAELRAGRRPHVAILYGGANDIVTASLYGQAGTHWHLPRITHRLEHNATVADLLERSSVYRLVRRWRDRHGRRIDHGAHDSEALAQGVVSAYVTNVTIARALGQRFDFQVFVFWQPMRDYEPMRSLVGRVRAQLPLGEWAITDLTHAVEGDAFVDWSHTTPEGNATIARSVARVVSR
jgi:hypothetical protein